MALVVIVLTAVATKLFRVQPDAPTAPYMTVNVIYSFLAAMLGGYICAAIAGRPAMKLAIVMAVLVLLLGVASAWQMRGQQPAAYQVVLNILLPIGIVLGAYLHG